MTVTVRAKRLRLKFFFSLGFVFFIAKRAVKRRNAAAGKIVGDRRIRAALKDYKKRNGPLVLAQIEKDGVLVKVRL